uniref:Pancreatic lipase-related protein 2 n=1 Tax=Cacopsylla melanoneura TaxID=428564 RepID=A0A8D8RAR8_9HEMI
MRTKFTNMTTCRVQIMVAVWCLFGLVLQLANAGFMGWIQKKAKCYRMPMNYCPYQDVTLWYYSNNLANSGGIQVTMNSIRYIPIVPNAPWKIIFHGFRNSKDGVPNIELRKAYFSRGVYNIISADVSKPIDNGPGNLCYPSAARNVLPIGLCFAQQLDMLIRSGFLPGPDRLHFVGHSLGAHIAGNTASALRGLIGTPVYRVTGLDPAGPLLWKRRTPDFKILDSQDAAFVDAHHTNGGVFFAKGQMSRLGTVDVYYNGGRKQPKCKHKSGCSHHKTVLYYAESINPLPPLFNKFYGFLDTVNNFVLVGEDMQLNFVGVIHINTNAKSPFAQGINTFRDLGRRDTSSLDPLSESSRNITSSLDPLSATEAGRTARLKRHKNPTSGCLAHFIPDPVISSFSKARIR